MSINILSSSVLNGLYSAGNRTVTGRVSAAAATASSVEGSKDSVTISNAARQALGAEQIPTVSEEAAREGIPEGMVLLQAPSWLSDFGLKLAPSDPGFAQMYPQAAAAPPDVLTKFGTKLFEQLAAVGAANGLTGASPEVSHQKLIADKQSSEQIRKQFVAGIRQDPEMMSVMTQLGLTGMLDASDAHAATGVQGGA